MRPRYTIHIAVHGCDEFGETAFNEEAGVTLDFATTDLDAATDLISQAFDALNRKISFLPNVTDRRPEEEEEN